MPHADVCDNFWNAFPQLNAISQHRSEAALWKAEEKPEHMKEKKIKMHFLFLLFLVLIIEKTAEK